MMATVEEDELATHVLNTACSELGADKGVLMSFDPDVERLYVRASTSVQDTQLPPESTELVMSVSELLLSAREQVLIEASGDGAIRRDIVGGPKSGTGNTPASPQAAADLLPQIGATSLLFSPLLAMDAPVGALVLAKSEGSPSFAPGDGELLSVLCGQAAVALQNARLFEQIQRAYHELQKLDHMKSEFINIAAHELRTPLAILMGHADLLESDVDDGPIKDRLQIIVRNALRLRGLIDALLDLRHLQSGESRVRISAFDIGDLIDTVLDDFRRTADENEIEISVDVPADLEPVQSDRAKIQYALTNLIDNAIRFTSNKGKVGVDVSAQAGEIWIAVWDTGVGIPSEEFGNIFRAFYQVEDSLTREHEGMGVGLSITKELIELCGGRIWVESVVSEGSRFTFTIPK
jgi:signal transduction histidine kinase